MSHLSEKTDVSWLKGKGELQGMLQAEQGLHVATKPIGTICNLGCAYFFYPEKKARFCPTSSARFLKQHNFIVEIRYTF
jgi:sulfatase maturation enzyme AslB (radical SAM superfamily)